MPSQTTKYALPFPTLSDPPNGADQIQDLAERVELVLTTGDFPSGTGRPHIAITRTSDFTFPNSGWITNLVSVSVKESYGGMSVSGARVVVPVAGNYLVIFTGRFALPAPGYPQVWTKRNSDGDPEVGSTISLTRAYMTGAAGQDLVCSAAVRLSQGDRVEAFALASVANGILQTGNGITQMSVTLL